MIVYRHFRNADVPRIAAVWNQAELGPGAAVDFPLDAFDALVLSEPYFDRTGLILACDDRDVVGFAHAGFGPDDSGTAVCRDTGIICAIAVLPLYRRRGIGRELLQRAQSYLLDCGARQIVAGEALHRCPFYLGLYGGADAAGFLDSDPLAAVFFQHNGFSPAERFLLLSRELQSGKPPFEPRTVVLKREVKFGILDHPPQANWWWFLRHGRFESLTFTLVPTAGGPAPAEVTCWGMELHAEQRNQRLVGLTGLFVTEKSRRRGFAKVLLCDVLRRLRDEGVTHVEVVVPEANAAARALFDKLGFTQTDAGTVFRR